MAGMQMRLVREEEGGGGGRNNIQGGWLRSSMQVVAGWCCSARPPASLAPGSPLFEFMSLCCPEEVRQIHFSSYSQIATIASNDSAARSAVSPLLINTADLRKAWL